MTSNLRCLANDMSLIPKRHHHQHHHRAGAAAGRLSHETFSCSRNSVDRTCGSLAAAPPAELASGKEAAQASGMALGEEAWCVPRAQESACAGQEGRASLRACEEQGSLGHAARRRGTSLRSWRVPAARGSPHMSPLRRHTLGSG
eukprot:359138-Chlamydomonas_euryale.AAC.6